MRYILISADGGLRWYDHDCSSHPPRINILCHGKLNIITKPIQFDPCKPERVERREYEHVGGGDGFEVYREVL